MDKSATRLARRVLKLYRELGPEVQRRAYRLNATCREGCSHCCYQFTPTTLAEAAAMVEHLLARPDGDAALDRALESAQVVASRLPAPSVHSPERTDQYSSLGLSCPLLTEDGRCSVYAARPFACRTHFVRSDPELCDVRRGLAEIMIIGMGDLHIGGMKRIAHVLHLEGYPSLWLAPLPVMLLSAAVLVRQGPDAFEASIKASSGTVFDPSAWDSLDMTLLSAVSVRI